MGDSRRDKLAAEKRLCERIAATFSTGQAQVGCGLGGVCDVVTARAAIEVEPLASWQTGLGQALTYSAVLDRPAVLWLCSFTWGDFSRRAQVILSTTAAVGICFVVQVSGWQPEESLVFFPKPKPEWCWCSVEKVEEVPFVFEG